MHLLFFPRQIEQKVFRLKCDEPGKEVDMMSPQFAAVGSKQNDGTPFLTKKVFFFLNSKLLIYNTGVSKK